ncbi:Gti1/Pac2 family domain-containing protein [Trichoderma velutinum]
MAGQTPLYPAFKGHVATTWDALLLFESCLQGHINHVPRQPNDLERQELSSSGNIFIYEEHASGIKRWIDGISWSPSRFVGNFLIYRELENPPRPGEKRRALKRKRGSQSVIKANSQSNSSVLDPATIAWNPEGSLVGPLVDSCLFKARGLVKKTITIAFQGVPHHLVSYYRIEDVDNKRLVTPSGSPLFQSVKPREGIMVSVPGIATAAPLSTYSSMLGRAWLEDDSIQAQQPGEAWARSQAIHARLPHHHHQFLFHNHLQQSQPDGQQQSQLSRLSSQQHQEWQLHQQQTGEE